MNSLTVWGVEDCLAFDVRDLYNKVLMGMRSRGMDKYVSFTDPWIEDLV